MCFAKKTLRRLKRLRRWRRVEKNPICTVEIIPKIFSYIRIFLYLCTYIRVLTNLTANMKQFYTICLLVFLAITASAQEQLDMTKYITNPSFENGTKGWAVSGLGSQSNNLFVKADGTSLKAGSNYMEKWVGTGGSVGSGSARQVLKDLPMGVYRLTVGAQNQDQGNKTRKCLGAYIFAGDQKTTVYTPDDYSVDFSYTAGDVEIGFVAESAQGNWIAVDNFRLYKTGDVSIDDAKAVLLTTLETANEFYGDGTGNNAAELKAAIDAAQAVYDAATDVAAIADAISRLKAAVEAYHLLNYNEEHPLDKTEYIANPSFENGTTSWTVTGLGSQGNMFFKKTDGSYYMEKWVGTGSKVGNASARQTLKNLPNGIYKLTVGAQNMDQGNEKRLCTGAYIFAGDQKTTVYTADDYSVKFSSIAGEVEIGYVAEDADGNWLAVDNFRLYQIGDADVMGEIQRLIAAAEGLEIPAEIAATYQLSQQITDALAAARALTESSTDKEISAAIIALQKAIADEEGLIAKALFAYHVNNPTEGAGAAPKVTETNHFVATGATQALMRATMTGTDLMEKGVCWSTEHHPTVLDNRTTKSFSLNGTVFHVKDLKPATVYYLRPYAMNKTYQVAYGDEVKIVTIDKGTCTWDWDGGAPDDAANARCRDAMKATIDYFNEWTGIKGFHLSGHFGSGTPTADCSYGGWMRIGPNAAYQAIGTVLHETGHGVGVGTQDRWFNENYHSWVWLGRQANEVYHFLENQYNNPDDVFVGDGMHGWGANAHYDWLVNGADKDTHQEFQYIGGMCIMRGLFIDGLCPTGSYPNGISGYTYNFDDAKKYFLMCKSTERGLGTSLLYQRNATSLGWKENLMDEALSDSAAWYMEYNAREGYYMFRNVATGRYMSHQSALTMKKLSSTSTNEFFQLIPDRKDVTIGTGKAKLTTHGYWVTWENGGSKAMNANKFTSSFGYGLVVQEDFDCTNSATSQQWIIISEDELPVYREASVSTSIQELIASKSQDELPVYDLQGRRVVSPKRGLYIINGRKVFIK